MHAGEPSTGLVLGLDGGGSRCAAVLGRLSDGPGLNVLGRGVGGTANPRVAGHETARASLLTAIHAAFAEAGIDVRPVATACFGLAGVGLASDRDAVLAWATQVPVADRVIVVPDGMLPFADGEAEPWGIVLIAGTGSLALARRRGEPLAAESTADRCGGWGPVLGDEGSGHSLGLAALKAAMRAADGRGPDTILKDAVTRRFAVQEPADLVAKLHAPGVGRREIADVAREALAAANVGDAVATGLVAGAAADLALHVRALAERNEFATGVYPLRFTGGLLVGSPLLRQLVVDSLTASGHQPGSVTVVGDPAIAAARFAASMGPQGIDRR